MATRSPKKRPTALNSSQRFRDLKRKKARRLHLEQLEDRRVMAIFVLPNNGELLNEGTTRTIAPADLTFRFTEIPGLDPTTIAGGIRLTRAGGDGAFGQTNDVNVVPGFIGLGDNNREVVMRFAGALPDDTYRITIVGAGTAPLRDISGAPINLGADFTLNFRLDLGAQVIAIVPQPVRRLANNSLVMNEINPLNPAATRSTQNMIYVYFNDDDLDPAAATRPEFYRLYATRNTLDPSDDVEVLPTSVEYDASANLVRLIFSQVTSLDQLVPFVPGSGIPDPIGSFRLRIGTNEPVRNGGLPTVTQQLGLQDPGSAFATAVNLGTQITSGPQGATVGLAQAIEAQVYTLEWPGALDTPGERDIPADSHLLLGADVVGGIPTIFYNFQDVIGSIPDGIGGSQLAFNLITENQKQRTREIFELYTRYAGVQFVESENSGLTIATGDMRAINPLIPTGPGGVAGLADPLTGRAIMDNGEVWDDAYGANWFQTAMHEIGHLLGVGHTYDLPPLTIQGNDGGLGPTPEPIFPGDHDIVHMRHRFRPDSKDIDMFRFVLDGTGVLTVEAFAERLPNSSGLDTHLRLYRAGANGAIDEIARNDDYVSKDSLIQLELGPGTYYVGVSASGNDEYDPTIDDSGMGGTTQGNYELKLDFRKSASESIVDRTLATGLIPDTLNVAFDGDADGVPGGVHNFWFRAAPLSVTTGRARTIFVDKAASTSGNGLITSPYRDIDDALNNANQFDIIRIVGNGGADGNLATLHDNLAYQLGFGGPLGTTPLQDGTELAVPKNVTVMIDAGAIFQLRRSQLVVGSTSPSIFSDRSGGALQVLGTPTTSVYFTSYNEVGGPGVTTNVGLDQNPLNVPPAAGDWGGLSFRNDLDIADGRFDHEAVGVFLNYVNHADIRFGGGQVSVDSVSQVVTPINLLDRRPTVSFNIIRNSANAAISANPDSFEETNFQEPQYWRTFSSFPLYNPSGVLAATPSTSFSLDYSRIGPDIHGNTLINNSTNGLFVRTRTPAGDVLEELTVSARFNDTDIVHVIEENLVVRGTAGGSILEQTPPPTELILPVPLPGLGNFAAGTSIEYRLVYVDLLGGESLASQSFFANIAAPGSAMLLTQLPQVPSQFVARKLYRRISPTAPFTLVDQIPASVSEYIDRNLPSTAPAAQLRVLNTPDTINRPRLDGGLVIDPSIILKLDGARVDVGIGANFIAEAFAGQEIVFTSLADDRYGAGTTFDTNNDSPQLPVLPVVTTLVQGSASLNEQQTVVLPGNPTAGAFTLTFNRQTTAPIPFNASAVTLRTALEGLANINPGDVTVALVAGTYTITFTGQYANQNVSQLVANIANSGDAPDPGDWGGLFFSADSRGSVDNAVFAYAGGLNRIEGTFAGFNPIEIHQADVRVAQSKFEFNADGQGGQAPPDRFSRGANAPATIFVRGAQPIIMDNIVIDNEGAFINVNVNALIHEKVVDSGRQTGLIEREPGQLDNNGPLVLRNRLRDNEINGMIVRGGVLTTESVWDDTGIVHVLFDAVLIPDFHVFGGLRLESSATESLVVKASGANAGFTATGRPLEIDDRIGGMLHVLGQPGVPVVMTGFSDDTAGAGLTPEGIPQTDTDGNGGLAGGGGLPTGPEVNNGTLIDNDVDPNLVGHFSLQPGAGGSLQFTAQDGVTAQGNTQLFIDEDFIFEFLNFVDVGPSGAAIDLATTTITSPPTLVSPDLVVSMGNFQGANGLVNWRVETSLLNGQAIVFNRLILTSAQPLGALRFINYLDEDVLLPFDDLLYQVGSPGQADFRLFTLDNAERIGFSQGGVYVPGPDLVNAAWEGWAADAFNDLGTAIIGAGTTYTPTGNIDTTDLPPFVDPALGNVHGLADVTTAMSWVVDPLATTATITSFLELIPQAPASAGTPGEWQGITIDQWAHDRNVETILELETGDGTANSTPQRAQLLGGLAPFEKGGDENLRLGFTAHGLIANTSDVDVYSFSARSATEVWIEIDRTTHALNSIVELIDNNGNVLARSNNSPAEHAGAEARIGLARDMQKTPPFEGKDFYTTNPRDGGMRVVLPGPANTINTYFVRVRSAPSTFAGEFGNSLNPGLTSGAYQLQVRLREVDEFGGSTVRFAQISNAVNGIRVSGQPTHSPLGGEATEVNTVLNDAFGGSQFIGNLLNSDRGVLSVGGALASRPGIVNDVDWYSFNVNYGDVQGFPFDSASALEDWWSTIFDIDYADGLARPNLVVNVFDSLGNLVLSSRDSNVADDGPNPLFQPDASDLSRGSFGAADPWIGPVELPQGQYFVAISADNIMPAIFDQFTNPNSATPLVRLEPMDSVRRIVEEHISFNGGQTGTPPIVPDFITGGSILPWDLHDVTLFVTRDQSIDDIVNSTQLLTVDPFSGLVETTVGSFGQNVGDIAMHPAGRLHTYSIFRDTGNNGRFADAIVGNYFQISSANAAATLIGDDGITTNMQDPASAMPAAVLANDLGNNNRVGEGVHFRAIEIANFPGNPLTGGIAGLAIGGRDPLSFNGTDAPNILYAFNPDTGVPSSIQVADRSGLGLLPGPPNIAPAGTNIVERGVLNTLVDSVPGGNSDVIQVVEATLVNAANGATTFQIFDSGYPIGATRPPEIPTGSPTPTTFAMRYGGGPANNVTFEFDAGPEALFQINGTSSLFIRDGQGFNINATGTVFAEFDTGPIINVQLGASGFVDGNSFEIVAPAGGGAHVFEFDDNGNAAGIPIPIGGNATTMANAIVTAINQQNLTTRAFVLPGSTRISLVNEAGVPLAEDADVLNSTALGVAVQGGVGVQGTSIRIRIEETSLQTALVQAFADANATANNRPTNSVTGVSNPIFTTGGDNLVMFGFDGNRLNLSGATSFGGLGSVAVPGVPGTPPALSANVLRTVGSQGGVALVPAGRVAVPFLSQDSAADVASRMAAAINNRFSPATPAFQQGATLVAPGATIASTDPPLTSAAQAPGGTITGMAAVDRFNAAGDYLRTEVYAVSDAGGLFLVVNPFSTNAQLDYINSAVALEGLDFGALTVGPPAVEGNRYREMLFGVTDDGVLHAFDVNGILQPIFNSRLNTATGLMEAQSSVQLQNSTSTELTSVNGLAFSTLDRNLWQATPNTGPNHRQGDAGHGFNTVVDDSRAPSPGGSSLHFGSGINLTTNSGIDSPGGSHGTVESVPFSLRGYSAADNPVLYYSYFLDTENVQHGPGANNGLMRDAFRVFVSSDDGEWHLLTTSDSARLPGALDDDFDFAPARVKETWDDTGSWRQVRVELADFAGLDNLRLRFDFSTAGEMNVGDASTPVNGDDLRTVDGMFLRDQQTFTLSAGSDTANPTRTFEFDLGYTLVVPNGIRMPDGARFTVDGVPFEFNSIGTAAAGFTPINFLTSDSPEQLAQRVFLALRAAIPTLPVQVNGNRLNLRGFDPATPNLVIGALAVSPGLGVNAPPVGFIQGAPGVVNGIRVDVHSGMTRDEVREAIALVMANVYAGGDRAQIKTDNEIIRLIGSNFPFVPPTPPAGPAPQFGYRFVSQTRGPFADLLNQRLLGVTTFLPGDDWGAFNSAQRGQNNAIEGVYIDDIIIGFAERGEMVSGAGRDNQAFINNPVASATNIIEGAYQLEIRRAPEAGVPTGSQTLPRLALLPSIDTNDRLNTSRTLIAPAGFQVVEGQFFTLSDGVNQVTFEFNDLAILGSGVQQGRIRIDFNTTDTDDVMARRIRNAINSAPVQAVLRVVAQLSDGVTGNASTSNQVHLIGSISILNGGSAPGAINLLLPSNGPETNTLGFAIDNDINVNTVGHLAYDLASFGGQFFENWSATFQGETQRLVQANFVFLQTNYIDIGLPGDALSLLDPAFSTITSFPTIVAPDVLETRGTFQGENAPIDWVVRTSIANGSTSAVSAISFDSVLPLGALQLINYLEIDANGFDNDFVYQVGTPGQANFRVFTVDGAEAVGVGQGGIYTPGAGLVNAQYDGWTADAFPNLIGGIEGPFGLVYSVAGNINAVNLPPVADDRFGTVFGPADVGTAMAWSVDEESTTATITTFVDMFSVSPLGNMTFRVNNVQYGDRNLFRDQGQIILQGNEIRSSSEWGILIDAAPRDPADGGNPHAGPVRNLRELNTQRLVPGVVVTNNTIYNNGSGGIRFSGDPGGDASVAFGRITNNTLFGEGGTLTGGTSGDVGIQVDQNAGPTILNNIVANFNIGVSVDATSQGPTRTVLGGTVFQGNRTDSNIGLGSSFPIQLLNSEPLFVNPSAGNFYLAAGSRAIDSSVDSLLDRPSLVTVRNPLGISQSPILAPDRDGVGQLRVDDPSVNTPQGFGLNPFKDRGAIDRVDFVGPTSLLTTPPDNDAEGTDLDPAPTTVVRSNTILRDFRIQLIDRFDVNGPPEGSDIDDLSVTPSTVLVEVISGDTPVIQQQGRDYSFAYDATNNTIILTPLGGLWPLGQTYRITLDNSVTGIRDRAGNPLLPNQGDGTSHFYTIFLGSAVDFGDAPDSYDTLSASGGPSHQIVPAIRLGPTIGAEADGLPSAAADADISDDGVSDFVLFPGGAANSSSVAVLAFFTTTARLDGWIDLNRDGDFDASEYVIQSRLLTAPGVQETVTFTLPNGPRGTSFARFRISTDGINTPTGHAPDGEVEDYQVTIVGPQFQNGDLAEDVTNDGVVSVFDLLVVVNFITTLTNQLLPGNSVAFVPPTAAFYQTPVPTFDPTGGGIPGQGRFVDVTGDGVVSILDMQPIINYITLNFVPSGSGEGEGEGDFGEGESAPAMRMAAAATTQSTTVGTARPITSAERDLFAASLLAAPNVILEVRQRHSDISPLAADWTSPSDDDTLAVVAAAATFDQRSSGRALSLEEHARRRTPIGPLDEDAWDELLGELALDVGGLPDEPEDQA